MNIGGCSEKKPILIFRLGNNPFAIDLSKVERVLPAMTIQPLSQASERFCGWVDVGGTARPVVDLRKQFGFPTRGLELSDRFLLVEVNNRPLALLVEAVEQIEVIEVEEMPPSGSVPLGASQVQGVIHDGFIYINDLESCLSLKETELDQVVVT